MQLTELRTRLDQPDVLAIIASGTILAPTFVGGGNPPYEEMKALARMCYEHFLHRSNVLLILAGESNDMASREALRAMGDALREHFRAHGPTPLYVVVGRDGPNLMRGFGTLGSICEALGLPYRSFGFDSTVCEVASYARRVDDWMKDGGREVVAAHVGTRRKEQYRRRTRGARQPLTRPRLKQRQRRRQRPRQRPRHSHARSGPLVHSMIAWRL